MAQWLAAEYVPNLDGAIRASKSQKHFGPDGKNR